MSKHKNDNPLGIEEPKSRLATLPVGEIREADNALRPVQRESESYQGLVDSVRQYGILKPVLVKQQTDSDTGEVSYLLIDGRQRFNAAKDAGLAHDRHQDRVDGRLRDHEGADRRQHPQDRDHPGPVQRAAPADHGRRPDDDRRLARRLARHEPPVGLRPPRPPEAREVDRRPGRRRQDQPDQRLQPGQAADRGAARVRRPRHDPPARRVRPQANERIRQIKEAKRAGRSVGDAVFTPVAHLQKLSAFKDELANGTISRELIARTGVADPVEAFKLAIQWSLHLDPESVKGQVAAEEARKAKLKDAAAKRKAEQKEVEARSPPSRPPRSRPPSPPPEPFALESRS